MGGVSRRPKGGHDNCFGQNNIKNEFSAIKLVRLKIFSQIGQILKKSLLGGSKRGYFEYKNPPERGILNFRPKNENVTSLHLWSQGFLKKIRKI